MQCGKCGNILDPKEDATNPTYYRCNTCNEDIALDEYKPIEQFIVQKRLNMQYIINEDLKARIAALESIVTNLVTALNNHLGE